MPVGGTVYLRVLIDRPMIVILGGHGRTIFTGGFQNELNSESVTAFAEGGEAMLIPLEAIELHARRERRKRKTDKREKHEQISDGSRSPVGR